MIRRLSRPLRSQIARADASMLPDCKHPLVLMKGLIGSSLFSLPKSPFSKESIAEDRLNRTAYEYGLMTL